MKYILQYLITSKFGIWLLKILKVKVIITIRGKKVIEHPIYKIMEETVASKLLTVTDVKINGKTAKVTLNETIELNDFKIENKKVVFPLSSFALSRRYIREDIKNAIIDAYQALN